MKTLAKFTVGLLLVIGFLWVLFPEHRAKLAAFVAIPGLPPL